MSLQNCNCTFIKSAFVGIPTVRISYLAHKPPNTLGAYPGLSQASSSCPVTTGVALTVKACLWRQLRQLPAAVHKDSCQ